MFPASIAPSVFPAPTIVCSSSMNKRICPSASLTSFKTACSRSSNSPRYFAPATSALMSKLNNCLFFRLSGTSPRTIRCASPSTIAVFPTPGSPIKTGLFFVFRLKIRMTRRISSSRPMTGSVFPDRKSATRSRPYFFSTSNVSSGFFVVTFRLPRILTIASRSVSSVMP